MLKLLLLIFKNDLWRIFLGIFGVMLLVFVLLLTFNALLRTLQFQFFSHLIFGINMLFEPIQYFVLSWSNKNVTSNRRSSPFRAIGLWYNLVLCSFTCVVPPTLIIKKRHGGKPPSEYYKKHWIRCNT